MKERRVMVNLRDVNGNINLSAGWSIDDALPLRKDCGIGIFLHCIHRNRQ